MEAVIKVSGGIFTMLSDNICTSRICPDPSNTAILITSFHNSSSTIASWSFFSSIGSCSRLFNRFFVMKSRGGDFHNILSPRYVSLHRIYRKLPAEMGVPFLVSMPFSARDFLIFSRDTPLAYCSKIVRTAHASLFGTSFPFTVS